MQKELKCLRLPKARELIVSSAVVWAFVFGWVVARETLNDSIDRAFGWGAADVGVIPAPCGDERSMEADGVVRGTAPDRCWITVESFRRLHPVLATVTDIKSSAQQPPRAAKDDGEDEFDWTGWLTQAGTAFGPLLIVLLALALWRRPKPVLAA
jgi:hypothetical protein